MNVNANWLAAPVVIPLLFAASSLLVATRVNLRQMRIQRNMALIASLLNLGVALLLLYTTTIQNQRMVLHAGLWQAPFGITLVADALSAIMLTLTAVLMVMIVLYAIGTLDQREGLNFHPLLLFLLMGVNGAFLAGDLFNLYVFFEVLLMASFVLLSLGGRAGQVNGGMRYVVLNLLASTVFLTTAGVVYGSLGTLNLAHLAIRMEAAPLTLRIIVAGMLLIAYGSKAGLFPLFFWLPASYHTPHPAVTAVFGGLLTKVGIYALFRVFTLLFPELLHQWQPLLLGIAGLTMLAGVFGAMAVNTIRRVLSFHIISQVGYMVMGLGLAGSNELALGFGLAAGIFYIMHHMIVKTALLMAGGAAELTLGTGQLREGYLGGLFKRFPLLAAVFFIAAFSLAGIPPSSGFVSKLGLLQAALGSQHWMIAGLSLLVSALTLISMVRLWQKGFAGKQYKDVLPPPRRPVYLLTVTPIVILVVISLGMGIFSDTFIEWSQTAANQLIDRAGYIEAVAPTDVIAPVSLEH